MKIGANSVLFGAFPVETAFKYLAMSGYDGIELSAIPGMSEHLVIERWRELAPGIKKLSKDYGLELLAMEQPRQDPERMEAAFQAAVELGIPIVNCGPGGKSDDPEAWPKVIDSLGNLANMAQKYGITLCVKAHVGASIYNTPTTLQAMNEIASPAFGIDMDPSHIHRSGEKVTHQGPPPVRPPRTLSVSRPRPVCSTWSTPTTVVRCGFCGGLCASWTRSDFLRRRRRRPPGGARPLRAPLPGPPDGS